MGLKVFSLNTDVLTRLKNGDEAAFSAIYERYYSEIYNFIFSFLKQKQLAEELLQETFLTVWVQRQKIDPYQPLEPLLFTICRRKVLDNFRKITSTEALKQQLLYNMQNMVNNTEEAVFYNDTIAFTNDALEKLPKQQQVVFKLSRLEGLSYEEIAERMDLSKNTVKNHLVAALKTLKLHFKEHGVMYLFFLIFHN
nr:RNA polymerase sigma-70 factor [Mucilaginibacter sp. L294]